jgi:hypothetical protein
MRSLLGGSDEALVHDPGAKGPEGEGEAGMTMMVIVYAVALGLIVYGAYRCPATARARVLPPRPPPHAPPHLELLSHTHASAASCGDAMGETARGTPRAKTRAAPVGTNTGTNKKRI